MVAVSGVLFGHALEGAPQATSTGELVGFVRDSQGLAVTGALVSLSGPSVIGPQTAETNRDGSFHFRALMPGAVRIVAEKAGFEPSEKNDIPIRTGTSMVAHLTLRLAGVNEGVTVTSREVIDRKTGIGTTLGASEVTNVPSATDTWAVLAQSPGIRLKGFDVGGSHKNQQTQYETFGILSENRIVSDGVDSTEGAGGAGLYYDFYAVEEFRITAAGADVTMTGPGASVVMAIKSGGDELSGLFHLDYEGSGMVGDNSTPEFEARGGYTGNPNLLLWETHVDLGGPLVRERAWFYGAYNHFRLDKAVGIDPSLGTADWSFDNFTGKATVELSPRDRLIGYGQWGRKQGFDLGVSTNLPRSATRDQNAWSFVRKVEWQRSWSEHAFGLVRAAHFGQDADFLAKSDPETAPRRNDQVTGIVVGSPGDIFIRRSKPQVAAELDYYRSTARGGHDIKLGIEWMLDQREQEDRVYSVQYIDDARAGRRNGVRFLQLLSAPSFQDIVNDRLDFYVQDRFTPWSRLFVTAGFRASRQEAFYHATENTPQRLEVFPTERIPGRTVETWWDVAPRLGATFDVTGRGDTVVKAYYGRFYVNLADRFASAHPAGLSSRLYDFPDPNGNGLYDGPHELGQLLFDTRPSPDALDESIEHAFTDEISFSLERAFTGSSALRLSYVRKTLKNDFGLWDVVQGAPLLDNPIPCGDALFPCPSDPLTSEPLALVRLDEELFDVHDFRVDNYPDARDTYETMQLSFEQRPWRNVWVHASFDYQWRDELRRASASPDNALTDPIRSGYFQNHHPSASNRQSSTSWQAKALARFQLPLGLAVAASFRHQSGFPWAPISDALVPGSGFRSFLLQDISENRSEPVTLIDLRFEKTFEPAYGHRLSMMLDVFNLMNSSTEVNFVLRANSANYLNLLGALDPRTFKIGARWQF